MSVINKVLNIFKTTHRREMSPASGEFIDKEGKVLDFTEWLKLLIDSKDFSLKIIDSVHSHIHEDSSFYSTDVIVLAEAGIQNYLIDVPTDGKEYHFGYENITNGIFTIEVFEATDKVGSVELPVLNRNRNSLATSALKIYKGITGGTIDGTSIFKWSGGAVQGNSRTAIGNGSGLERILKNGTKYIFRITSGSASTTFSTRFDFYQEDIS